MLSTSGDIDRSAVADIRSERAALLALMREAADPQSATRLSTVLRRMFDYTERLSEQLGWTQTAYAGLHEEWQETRTAQQHSSERVRELEDCVRRRGEALAELEARALERERQDASELAAVQEKLRALQERPSPTDESDRDEDGKKSECEGLLVKKMSESLQLAENELKAARERLSLAEEREHQREREVAQLQDRLEGELRAAEMQVRTLEESLKQQRQEVDDMHDLLDERSKALTVAEAQVRTLTVSLKQQAVEMSEKAAEVAALKSALEAAADSMAGLQIRLEEERDRERALRRASDESDARCAALEAQLQAGADAGEAQRERATNAALRKELEVRESESRALRSALQAREAVTVELQARFHLLQAAHRQLAAAAARALDMAGAALPLAVTEDLRLSLLQTGDDGAGAGAATAVSQSA